MEPAPEPHHTSSLEDFIAALRQLKLWYGNPSISQLTGRIRDTWRAAGRPPNEWPSRATVGRCFTRSRQRVDEDLVVAVVEAIVGDQPRLIAAWQEALRRVLGQADASASVTVEERLPGRLRDFTGRGEILTWLANSLAASSRSGVRCATIFGMAGIGKTSLAVQLGHELAGRGLAGDRVMFVDLRGFDPSRPPASPHAVLGAFLRILGLPANQIPHRLDTRAGKYQSLLKDRSATIILDNAAGEDQIEPLLPHNSGCSVIVTSRTRLTTKVPSVQADLEVFTPDEALTLLRNACGAERIDADLVSAAKIAYLLGYLPLAVAIVAGHVRSHPDWLLTDYLEPLVDLLVRAYAADRARLLEPSTRRRQAIERLREHYVHTAGVAVDLVWPALAQRRPSFVAPQAVYHRLHDAEQAGAWLDAERHVLLTVAVDAVGDNPLPTVWLSRILGYHWSRGGHYDQARALHQAARQAAKQLRDPALEAWNLHKLGEICGLTSDIASARKHLTPCGGPTPCAGLATP